MSYGRTAASQLGQCEPVYESMPGWSTPTRGVRRFEEAGNAGHFLIQAPQVADQVGYEGLVRGVIHRKRGVLDDDRFVDRFFPTEAILQEALGYGKHRCAGR